MGSASRCRRRCQPHHQYIHAANSLATRSPECPSQSGIGCPGGQALFSTSANAAAIRSEALPTNRLVPRRTVIGRSVFSRSVKHGTPSTDVSSCNPPESVSTTAAPLTREIVSRYGCGPRQISRSWPGAMQVGDATSLRHRYRPRVNRKHQRQITGEIEEQANEARERGRVVNIGRPVESDNAVFSIRETKFFRGAFFPGGWKMHQQRVDHDVPDQSNAFIGHALMAQIRDPTLLRDQQQFGYRISEEPVDLFRHRPVEATQSGLDVDDGDAQLDGRERAGDGAVDISEHDRRRRLRGHGVRFVAFDDARGLCAVAAGPDFEIHMGLAECRAPRRRRRSSPDRSAGRCG